MMLEITFIMKSGVRFHVWTTSFTSRRDPDGRLIGLEWETTDKTYPRPSYIRLEDVDAILVTAEKDLPDVKEAKDAAE